MLLHATAHAKLVFVEKMAPWFSRYDHFFDISTFPLEKIFKILFPKIFRRFFPDPQDTWVNEKPLRHRVQR